MMLKRFLTISIVALLLLSCGGSGTNKKREPSRKSKRDVEVIDKKSDNIDNDTHGEDERNNGNYRKSKQSRRVNQRRGNKEVLPEHETLRELTPNEARIEKRVKLEQRIWEASKSGNTTLFDQLKEEAAELAKNMNQAELDEAFRRIKDLKKRM